MNKRSRHHTRTWDSQRGFVIRDDYDWDYIRELMCDPELNLMDQIRYSEQIAQLRTEMNQFFSDQYPLTKNAPDSP